MMRPVRTLAAAAAFCGTAAFAVAAHAAEGGKSGMPQLDLKTFPSQFFWLTVIFGVFFVLMWKVALPRIGEILQEREDKIAGDLDRADKLKEEAKAVIAGYEKSMADARNDARETTRKTAEALAAEAARRQQEVGERLSADLAAAERRIAGARSQAMGNVKTMAADVAQAAFARLTGTAADLGRLSAAVERAAGGGR